MPPAAAQPMPDLLKRPLDFLRMLLPARFRSDIPVVPVVRLSGVIGVSTPLQPGLMLSSIARSLERAFATRNARAVALIVNSPGGSPSQSHLIYRRIRQLAEEKKLPVIAFVEDVGASGGYMLACAGDEIICDQFSIVGSIGVVGGSFGFPKLMEKLGVERRVYTAGERKVMLDPFQPEKPEDVKRIKAIQKDIHEHFIALVKATPRHPLEGRREDVVLGRILDGAGRDRSRSRRPHRRSARDFARTLRRESAHAADFGRPRPVRPPDSGARLARCARAAKTASPPTSSRRWKRARYGAATDCRQGFSGSREIALFSGL